MSTVPRCEYCGTQLKDRRVDCRHCGGPCRAAASRLRQASGLEGFRTALERARGQQSAQKRTRDGRRDARALAAVAFSSAQSVSVPMTIRTGQAGKP
jgi:hypothetical protein